MSKVECQQCDGTGVVTTMEPKALGRCSNGEMVYSSRTVPMNRFCDACQRKPAETGAASGVTPASTFRAESARNVEPVTFGGHEVDAPGYTTEGFARAMARALVDELEIHGVGGGHVVTRRGLNGGYPCSRNRCECKAGQVGQPCKHRAALIFHLDVREPALRRQWAAAERSVSRKAVAA
jgi:hypothetical protein